MGPYILIGLFLAGLIHIYVPSEVMKRIGGNGIKGPFFSALVGVPLPLCSCSVLPLAVQMRRSGASSGSTLAFLTSAPQTGVDSILVAYSFFGWPFALFKAGVSFLSGTLSGWISNLLTSQPAPEPVASGTCSSSECGDDGRQDNRIITVFRYGLIGIAAAGIISTLLPDNFFGRLDPAWLYYPAVLALSIPFYICATSSLPLAFALAAKGMPLGAVIVFLIAGPATNLATLGVVAKTLGRKHVFVFLFTIAVFAVISGVIFDTFDIRLFTPAGEVSGFEFPYIVQAVSGIILTILMIYHVLRTILSRIFLKKE